jgi:hypothetical protein
MIISLAYRNVFTIILALLTKLYMLKHTEDLENTLRTSENTFRTFTTYLGLWKHIEDFFKHIDNF